MRWRISAACVFFFAASAFCSPTDALPTAPVSAGDTDATLQVNINCGELKDLTDFLVMVDSQGVGASNLQYNGTSPCIGSITTPITSGSHTLTIQSRVLAASNSLPITLNPGKNWVTASPDGPPWTIPMQQEKTEPSYQ